MAHDHGGNGFHVRRKRAHVARARNGEQGEARHVHVRQKVHGVVADRGAAGGGNDFAHQVTADGEGHGRQVRPHL